jgi:hypothetical protein
MRKLQASDRAAAASACKPYLAAARSVTMGLRLHSVHDFGKAAEAIAAGRYRQLASLHLHFSSVYMPDLNAVLT